MGFGFAAEYAWWVAGLQLHVPWMSRARVLQDVAGLLDPVVLTAFALSTWATVRRPEAAAPNPALLTIPLVPVLVVWATGDPVWKPYVIEAYVDIAYLLAFALLVDAYARERGPYLDRQLRLLAWAVGFVALTRLTFLLWPTASAWPFLAAVVGMSCGALLVILAGHGLMHGSFRALRHLGPPIALSILVFTVALFAFWDPGNGLFSFNPDYLPRFYFSQRWLFFSLITGYGVLQHSLFPAPWMHRAVALLVSATVGIALGMVAGSTAGDASLGYPISWVATAATGAVLYVALVRGMAYLLPESGTGHLAARARIGRLHDAVLAEVKPTQSLTGRQERFLETLGRLRETAEGAGRGHHANLPETRK